MTYLVYVTPLALALIVGALIGGLYVMAKMGLRIVRHEYVCRKCGDEFRLWSWDQETPHVKPGDVNIP